MKESCLDTGYVHVYMCHGAGAKVGWIKERAYIHDVALLL